MPLFSFSSWDWLTDVYLDTPLLLVFSKGWGGGGVFSFPLSQGISLCILITFQLLNVSGYKTEYCTQILLLWHLHIYAIILNAMSFLYFYLMKRSPGTYIFDQFKKFSHSILIQKVFFINVPWYQILNASPF